MIADLLRQYKNIKQSEFVNGNYKLVPIRDEDKYAIMQWRNQQIDVLRQSEPLTKEKQEDYFASVVDKLFEVNEPAQLLFSFLENEKLIGYGGLVHIDWKNRTAEVSFLTQTNRANDSIIFHDDFASYLKMIFDVGFAQLNMHKLHTTFYDIPERVEYKKVIEEQGFVLDGKQNGHVVIGNVLRDAFIYSKLKKAQ